MSDLVEYGDAMRAWYTNVMPLWRRAQDFSWPLSRAKGPDDDWQQVMRGGANGLQVIVVALYWWMKVANSEAILGQAGSVCEDLVFVLSDMHQDTTAPEIYTL